MKKFPLYLAGLCLFFIGCGRAEDLDQDLDGSDPETAVQDFMWQAMNIWYFWQSEVPDLADDRFSTPDEYADYLAETPDPVEFFVSQLSSEDRFSFLVDDYPALINAQSGVVRHNGLEFGLFLLEDGYSVGGVVYYILVGSDAATKDISRGEAFSRVDGQPLNLDNYQELLFGENDTYVLGMDDINVSEGILEPNGEEVLLTKQDTFAADPIFITKTFDINDQKVGYLMYNSFLSDFDQDLNDAFGELRADGVTELVLDLRYNAGGSVSSAILLSSMITGSFTGEVFIRQRLNDKIMEASEPENLVELFTDTLETGQALNSLNLDRVYVLTTQRTSSASELVINGLDPYIEVVTIGARTTGKNEFSTLLVDDPDGYPPFLYSESRASFINSVHSWAIQPVIGRSENALGFSDYVNGLAPDIGLEEELGNLGVLGDETEPLLARAIEEITGTNARRASSEGTPLRPIATSRSLRPGGETMVLDTPLNIRFGGPHPPL